MELEINHDQNNHCFFAKINSSKCELKYKLVGNEVLDFQSTFVPEPLRDQGIAGEITKHALEYARGNNYQVIPSCPFVKQYVNNHPQYSDVIKN